MKEQVCPKCHSPRINGTEYCVCGHKWGELDIEEMFDELFGPKKEAMK